MKTFTRNSAMFVAETFMGGKPSLSPVPRSTKRGSYRYFLNKLAEGEWKGKIFKKGNSKLPFFAFSSLPALSCPGAGECVKFCYSFSSWRHPAAYVRQLSNSLLLQTEDGRGKIAAAFRKLPEGATVRLYVDGDFSSVDELAWWMELIRSRADLSVYGYSKSWEQFLCLSLRKGWVWPTNYRLNLSSGSKHGVMLRDRMKLLPITRGEFVAVPVSREHITSRSYQGKHKPGFTAYAAEVRRVSGGKVFVCPGRCGSCLPDGRHACGNSKFTGIKIAIGTH